MESNFTNVPKCFSDSNQIRVNNVATAKTKSKLTITDSLIVEEQIVFPFKLRCWLFMYLCHNVRWWGDIWHLLIEFGIIPSRVFIRKTCIEHFMLSMARRTGFLIWRIFIDLKEMSILPIEAKVLTRMTECVHLHHHQLKPSNSKRHMANLWARIK